MLSASPNLVLRMKECSYHSERFTEALLQAGILGYTQVSMYDLRFQLSNVICVCFRPFSDAT